MTLEEAQAECRESHNRRLAVESNMNFAGMCQRWARFDLQWRSRIPRENPPWPHASDYNPPISFVRMEDQFALASNFFSGWDFFSLAASSQGSASSQIMRQRAEDWTAYLRWSLVQESNGSAFIDRFLHTGLMYGSAFGYMPWLRLARSVESEQPLPEQLRRTKKMGDAGLIKYGLGPMLTKGPRKLSEGRYQVKLLDESGDEIEGVARIDRHHPYRPEGEACLILEREKVLYNAPRPKVIPPWNVIVPPHVSDLQTATNIWIRDHQNWGRFLQMKATGLYNALQDEDFQKLKERAERPQPQLSSYQGMYDLIESQRDMDMGAATLMSRQISDLEVWWEYYTDTSKGRLPVEMVRITLYQPFPVLLGKHRLEYLIPHGRRPFFDWHCFPVDDRYYGMGLCEALEPSQREANAFYQSRSDVLEIITKPGGMYDPMSGLAPREIKFSPGMFIQAVNPQTAIREWNFPTDPTRLLVEQSGIEMQTERVAGSTDMGAGRGPTRPNAPRTLGGTAIMIQQQAVRGKVILRQAGNGTKEISGGIREFLMQYYELCTHLMEPKKEFRVLGTDDIRVLNRDEATGRFDFIIDFGDEIGNAQLRLQNAALRMANALQNPLVMRDPQALWRITVDYYQATGMTMAHRILTAPQGAEPHPPLSQAEENAIIVKGMPVEVLLSDDHAAHVAEIQALIQDPLRMIQEGWTYMTIPLLEQHAQKHAGIMSALQTPPGQPAPPPGMAGAGPGVEQRGPRVTRAQMEAGVGQPQQPMAGPPETEVEAGIMG